MEQKFGAENVDRLFPPEAYQLTHNALFPHDCIHVENLGGEIGNPLLHNRRLTLGIFPWLFKGGEAAFCRAVAWLDDETPRRRGRPPKAKAAARPGRNPAARKANRRR